MPKPSRAMKIARSRVKFLRRGSALCCLSGLIFLASTAGPLHAQLLTLPTNPLVPVASPVKAAVINPLPLDAYHLLRTPAATLTLAVPTTVTLPVLSTLTPGVAPVATPAPLQPLARYGVFDEVNLGFLDKSGNPTPAAVYLQFDPSRAGSGVWVQPLDGGQIATWDANGKAVYSNAGAFLPIPVTGQVAFSFQALARSGRYQVLIRLDSVSTIMPFVILDPSLDN